MLLSGLNWIIFWHNPHLTFHGLIFQPFPFAHKILHLYGVMSYQIVLSLKNKLWSLFLKSKEWLLYENRNIVKEKKKVKKFYASDTWFCLGLRFWNLPNHTVFGEEELSIYLLELTWHTAVGSHSPPKKFRKVFKNVEKIR